MSHKIKYYSTNLRAPEVSFREALLRGIAPDGGLYMPRSVPELTRKELESFTDREYYEIAFVILNKFLKNEIGYKDLMSLCRDAYNFSVPLEHVADDCYILRLDQGPTASFKDFAVRMMARLMNYFIVPEQSHYTILTATSGDTGSAVASAFHGFKHIDVIILFPLDEVSETQRKQMTTLKGNISVVAVKGKFDDCQRIVKRAFADEAFRDLSLSSANSINIGRLLPQSVYYAWAWSRSGRKPVVFSVPSGNYGNLMGGLIAREMGLPVEKFVISANENNEVPEYLRTGIYRIISPSLNCISSAMNVGHPSNMARIIALYGGVMNEKGEILRSPDLGRMQDDFYGISVSDQVTRETIFSGYNDHRVLLEPHGAVAWKGLQHFLSGKSPEELNGRVFISLETAHPAKFPAEIRRILNFMPEAPPSLSKLAEIDEEYLTIENDYNSFREYIQKTH
ncbi:MAG TPA: threonine synthase [Bacteroidales bacterium]|nr:threonine synthase [Bacteroidales bacterium]HPM87638.1 threonine synthase [Bacteroidales bacterium]HQM69773.1 threonine synthase [Bacteroidales bacterium]